eukprot:TRINITY_DN3556_c0_g1_i1.p3 TRINITY_DN3556_c0_g1~~TRINITY_DN3556_c0_g1_i1.p3  ORF type:complete len:270 (-),score=58.40 TRINITY_DN3556_c0_g1_i1:299-1033(-)
MAARTDLQVSREELQILEDSLETHKQTTNSAKRSVQVVNEAKELAAATLAALEDQEQQMYRVKDSLQDVNEGVVEAKGILAWFNMCCICQCCGCEPPEMRKKPVQKKGKKGNIPSEVPDIKFDVNKVGAPGEIEMQDQNNGDNMGMATYAAKGRRKQQRNQARGPSGNAIGGTLGQQINEHTQQQDQYLDEIGEGLSDLKIIAAEIGNEVGKQAVIVDDLIQETDAAGEGVKGLNEHKVLRKFK